MMKIYRRSVINNYAAFCAMPGCNKKVSYHSKYSKQDGTLGAKWKTFCEYHRKDVIGKKARDIFLKNSGGCANKDSRLGYECKDPNTTSLTIDHWDGDKYNNDESNLVVLCANCHNHKTKLFRDHLKRYNNGGDIDLDPELFEVLK